MKSSEYPSLTSRHRNFEHDIFIQHIARFYYFECEPILHISVGQSEIDKYYYHWNHTFFNPLGITSSSPSSYTYLQFLSSVLSICLSPPSANESRKMFACLCVRPLCIPSSCDRSFWNVGQSFLPTVLRFWKTIRMFNSRFFPSVDYFENCGMNLLSD